MGKHKKKKIPARKVKKTSDKKKKKSFGFSLAELLISIGILAIISTITVLVINPLELAARTRDSIRITDFKKLDSYMSYAVLSGAYPGQAMTKVVYLSFPKGVNPPNQPCLSYSDYLEPLDTGNFWRYSCTWFSEFLQYPDSRGWVPIDFTNLLTELDPQDNKLSIIKKALAAIINVNELPIDPKNTTGDGPYGDEIFYYMFIAGTNTWEFVTRLESDKYQSLMENDGGYFPEYYEFGSDLTLWKEATNL